MGFGYLGRCIIFKKTVFFIMAMFRGCSVSVSVYCWPFVRVYVEQVWTARSKKKFVLVLKNRLLFDWMFADRCQLFPVWVDGYKT